MVTIGGRRRVDSQDENLERDFNNIFSFLGKRFVLKLHVQYSTDFKL